MTELLAVSVSDSGFLEDPYPAIAENRHLGVVPNVDQGGWWVLDSAEIVRLIRDPRLVNDPESADPDSPITAVLKQARLSVFYMDPPDHTRIRNAIKWSFTPRQMKAMQEGIVAIGTRLLDVMPDRGEVDIVSTFSDRLPLEVMTEFLGVEPERSEEFAEWVRIRLASFFDPKKSGAKESAEATDALRGYFVERLRSAATDRGTGLIDELRDGELSDQYSEVEKVDLLVIMLAAGITTTADLIANAINALVNNPDQLAMLRQNPDLSTAAVEETLRYDSPALSVGRILAEEREMFGNRLPAGTWLRIMTAAVGRDPAVNVDPDRFILDRERREHVAFGGGAHLCVGMHLGRLEAKIALDLLLRRYPTIGLTGDAEVAVRRTVPGFRGFERLVVRVGE